MNHNDPEIGNEAILGLVVMMALSFFLGVYFDWLMLEILCFGFALLCLIVLVGTLYERHKAEQRIEPYRNQYWEFLQEYKELYSADTTYIMSHIDHYSHNQYTLTEEVIILKQVPDYRHYQMVGMYYRFLGPYDLGFFVGYASAETYNQSDRYAVAIYRYDGKHLGYLERGQKHISEAIISQGGRVPCYGCIKTDIIGYYQAKVAIHILPSLQ